MARPRSKEGLYRRQLASGWTYYVRLNVEVDGVVIRKAFNLATQSKAVARRKVAQLEEQLAKGTAPVASKDVSDVETVEQACRRVVESAKRDGMKTWKSLQSNLDLHALPHIGHMHVNKVGPRDIRLVLEEARDKGLAKQSLLNLKNAMSKVFDSLWRDEDIPNNPVRQARLPNGAKQDHRVRVHMQAAEWEQLVSYLDSQPDDERINGMPVRELQAMCVAARAIGGQRTSDLHCWIWEDIHLDQWDSCVVRRSKTGDDHISTVNGITDILHHLQPGHQAHLKQWWIHEGKPKTGFVFPARKGTRAGEQKLRCSYAKELREALRRALGIVERKEVEKVIVRSNGRTMRVQTVEWEKVREMTERERMLLEPTASTLPTDFHSMRHAFCSGIAASGANLQTQMSLAGHRQAQTAMRYTQLGQTEQKPIIDGIPDAPLPRLRLVASG